MPEALTAWVEVNASALAHNLLQVRSCVGSHVRILAVVKADAYGHGAVPASHALLAAGAGCLGVTRVEEALELRDAGIEAPILVFSAALPAQAPTVVARDLAQTICTLEGATALSAAAQAAGRPARVHVKVDTGMGRLGIRPEETPGFLRALSALPGLHVEGIYTHFATAAEESTLFLQAQLAAFLGAARAASGARLEGCQRHCANSAGILRLKESHLDMVRPGTILYGQYPSAHVPRILDLRDTWQLKARVTFVKTVRRGEAVGYGRDFVAPRDMVVATLPLGYSDGVALAPTRTSRSARELLSVLREFARRGRAGARIGGRLAPFVGRIAMQMCCVDVTGIANVSPGDEAVLPARRTLTSSRLPRVWL